MSTQTFSIFFSRSLAENIAYGDNTREVPMEEVIAAARKANIHQFITNLPQVRGPSWQHLSIGLTSVSLQKVILCDKHVVKKRQRGRSRR